MVNKSSVMSLTEHVLAAAEGLSVSTVMHNTRRRFVTLAPSINVMTYLLTSIEQSATKCLCVKTSSGKVVVGLQPFPYLIVYRYQRELNLNLASN